jgi:hypothetical protein
MTTIRKLYYCLGMKKYIAQYIVKCLECQQVKVEHMTTVGLLHPLEILEWKWEVISIDFITGLPKTTKQHDVIMVLVDKLRKSAHFILIKSTF